MSTTIEIRIDDNAAEVARQVRDFPARLGPAIAREVDLQNELTVGHAQARKLSRRGPTTLGVVSNRLRSSLRPAKAQVAGDRVVSSIGSNVVYAAAHEYGFTGRVQVKSFVRQQRSNDLLANRAGEIARRGFAPVQKKEKLTALGFARVKAHARQMIIPARPFISSSLQERSSDYGASVSRAIVAAWQGGAS